MPIKLLFADDSVTIQKVVELAFESEDVAVTTVSSGEKAMEKLKESKPDVIIADVVMPGMNGLELCENVKKDENYSDIPVLLLRSEFDDFDAGIIGKVGAADCITKPFKSEDLVKKIKDIAGKRTENNELDIVFSELGAVEAGGQESAAVNLESIMDEAEGTASPAAGQEDALQDSENKGHDTEEIIDIVGEGGILSLESDDEVANEVVEGNEDISSIEIISPEAKIESEDLNISGLLSDEDIEKVKREIESAEERLAMSLSEDENLPESSDISFLGGEAKRSAVEKGDREGFIKHSPGINDFVAELEKESVITEKIKSIIIKTTEDVYEKTFRKFLENTVKNSTETIMKETTEKLILSLTPQIVKIIENTVWEIVPDLAESLIKKEIEKIKSGVTS